MYFMFHVEQPRYIGESLSDFRGIGRSLLALRERVLSALRKYQPYPIIGVPPLPTKRTLTSPNLCKVRWDSPLPWEVRRKADPLPGSVVEYTTYYYLGTW
jgi:hypothetical protein